MDTFLCYFEIINFNFYMEYEYQHFKKALTTNFNNKKLLVIIVINLYTNLQNKNLLVTEIVTIMNIKL